MALTSRLFAIIAIIFVSGCAATPPPNLSVAEIGGLRLAEVRVTFQPGALINYTPAEMELARARGVSPSDWPEIDALAKSPEGAAFVRQRATDGIRAAMLNEVGPVMNGARPVRLEVLVKQIDIPGAGRNIATALVFGAHNANVSLRATVVDARSGAPLIDGRDLVAFNQVGGGVIGLATIAVIEAAGALPSPYEALTRMAAKDYARWLNQGST